MNPLKRTHEEPLDSEYYPIRRQQSVNHHTHQMTEIFEEKTSDPSRSSISNSITFRKISKTIPLNDLQLSFRLMQQVAQALKVFDFKELKNLSDQISRPSEGTLKSLLQRYESLNLPQDLNEIRSILPSSIRPQLIASLINRDSRSIKDLNLTKEELKIIGPHLTYLDVRDAFDDTWSGNEIYIFLRTCVQIETLKINTDKIKRLPPLLSAKKLNCCRCVNLITLPELPLCEKLNCSQCTNLKFIKSLPVCRELNCFNCENLMELPPLPECEKLNCCNCEKLTALPLLIACRELKCCECTGLTELPSILLCENLNCSNCPNLNFLPLLPLCNELDCSGCINLRELPRLILCKKLYCNSCTKLTTIAALPLCKNLHCFDCISLIRLPPLPFCKNLFCIGCLCLIELPLLPRCESLSCDMCPVLDLATVPIPLRPQAVYAQYEPITLKVRVEDLEEDPLTVLLTLSESLLDQRMMPMIEFIERDGRKSPATDTGGVFRIFITRLMRSLISHSENPSQLKFQQANSKLYLPVFDPTRDVNKQIKAFQILGALFELCYQSAFSKQSVTIGQLFDRKLFDIITGFSLEELNIIDFNAKELPFEIKLKLINLHSEVHIKKVSQLLTLSPTEFTFKQFTILKNFTINLDEEEEKRPGTFDDEIPTKEKILELIPVYQERTKKILNEMPDVWLPAAIIRKQMYALPASLNEWNRLNQPLAQTLEANIQGIRDKASFLASLKWKIQDRALDLERFEKTKGYVERWIIEATENDLEGFCNFISGSPTTHPSKKLKFSPYDLSSEMLPATHTCHFQMDLTINYETYGKFKEKLELAMATVNSLVSSGLEFQ